MKAFWDKDSSQNRNFLFKCALLVQDDRSGHSLKPAGMVTLGFKATEAP
jgi:hypothetical protein